MLNNMRKYFLYTLIYFLILFSKINISIFKIKIILLLFIKFDYLK